MNLQIDLYCDGACSGNPGPGGFAYTLIAWNPNTNEALKTRHGNGYDLHTTNNRMELQAAIAGLNALSKPCALRVISDSQYLVKGMTEWIHNWQAKDWRTARKKPIEHKDLWIELLDAAQTHTITWTWTEGHSTRTDRFSTFNNLVDEEAAAQRDFAKRLATGTLMTVERAFALAEAGSEEVSVFYNGKLVALNGAIVERIEQRESGKYRICFQTFAREANADDELYLLP